MPAFLRTLTTPAFTNIDAVARRSARRADYGILVVVAGITAPVVAILAILG